MIGNSQARCPNCNCITKRQLLENLDLIPSRLCNPLQPSIVTTTPKKMITIPNPIGIIANGNYVYVSQYETGSKNGVVSKYNQDGNLEATFSVPEGTPRFLEIKCGNLYVVSRYDFDDVRKIFVKSLLNESQPFSEFLDLSATY